MNSTPDVKSRRLRFRLSSLLVLMALVSVLLAFWTRGIRPYQQQAASLRAVEEAGGTVEAVAAVGPRWQQWLVGQFLDSDRFVRVQQIDLRGKSFDDTALQKLAGLRFAEQLLLDHTQVTSAGLSVVRSMPKLRHLSLARVSVDNEGIKPISELEQLEVLYLTGTPITDEAVESLSKLKSLKQLYVRFTDLSESGIAALRVALPDCQVHAYVLTSSGA